MAAAPTGDLQTSDGPRRRRRWVTASLTVVVLILVVVSSCSWYLSERLAAGALRPNHDEDRFGMEVAGVSGGSVTLRAVSESYWLREGIWALEWRTVDDQGWAQVGAYTSADQETREAVRPILRGDMPPVGAEARLDNFGFLGTPLDFHLDYEEVQYASAHGQAAAWLVCGGRTRWLIRVHGKDGDPREMLRMLPTVAELGFATLSISYANDLDAPSNDSDRYEYGASEWRDVEGAVRFALDHGADEIVLAGHSMGGGIVASFLLESELAGDVAGAILDAPMLDFERAVSLGLEEGGIPGLFRPGPMWLMAVRFDIDWARLDYSERSDDFITPLLIFHGTQDRTTSIEASDELAEQRPDLVTYERVEGAHHTGAWNVDRDRYESALRAFISTNLGPALDVPSCTSAG